MELSKMRERVEKEKADALQKIDEAQEIMQRRGYTNFSECTADLRLLKDDHDFVERMLRDHIATYEPLIRALNRFPSDSPLCAADSFHKQEQYAQTLYDINQTAYRSVSHDFYVMRELCQHDFEHGHCKFCGIDD